MKSIHGPEYHVNKKKRLEIERKRASAESNKENESQTSYSKVTEMKNFTANTDSAASYSNPFGKLQEVSRKFLVHLLA